MSQDAIITLLTIFVGLVALSQVAQAIALLKLRSIVQGMHQQVTQMLPKAEATLKNANELIAEGRKQITGVASKANDVIVRANDIVSTANGILDNAKQQIQTAEGMIHEFSQRAKVQLERAEMVVDDTIGRVHETVSTVHNGVMKPIREVSGISAGIRAALNQMLRGQRRPSVAQVTTDEEMFI